MSLSWTQFRLLFLIHFLELRNYLAGVLFVSSFLPLSMVFGLGLIGSGQTKNGLIFIVTGAMVVSLVTTGVSVIADDFAQMKEHGLFLYYASLPVQRSNLLLSLLASRLMIQLPGILFSLIGGDLLYHLNLRVSPLLLVIIPLTALALSGSGAVIGIMVPFRYVFPLTSMVLFFMLFGSPVMIPAERLPLPLQILGILLPPSYAADGFRRILTGVFDPRLALDFGVLAAFTAASLLLVVRGVRWRMP